MEPQGRERQALDERERDAGEREAECVLGGCWKPVLMMTASSALICSDAVCFIAAVDQIRLD